MLAVVGYRTTSRGQGRCRGSPGDTSILADPTVVDDLIANWNNR